MTSSAVLILVGLLLSMVDSAHCISDVSQCAQECSTTGLSKFSYATENVYTYVYSVTSEIHLVDIEGGVSRMEWTAGVDLTWITLCDMVISFRNVSFGGSPAAFEADSLTKYPLVVAITDGLIQQVCSHPDDDVWSVNVKKGVASSIQNSLPSNSTINSGLTFTELDTAGRCPVKYIVEKESEKIIVKKDKNHRFCQERFTTSAETHFSWIKAPLPLQESKSNCRQEITNGIYTQITCKDMNVIKPVIGAYKYITAEQTSILQFQTQSSSLPQRLKGPLVQKSLRFDQKPPRGDATKVPELEEVLKLICLHTKEYLDKNTASQINKVIHLLRNVPEDALKQMLQNIRNGKICTEPRKVENMFLDAVAFVQESNTVDIIVSEILSDRTELDRILLYTVALYFTSQPSLYSIKALKPLFEQAQKFPVIALIAASMVNTYCKHNPHCQEHLPVRESAEALGYLIQQHCSSPENGESQDTCLVGLKALGNMGIITSEVAKTLFKCMEMEGMEDFIRIAAAQAFRNAGCKKEYTKHLMKIAVNREMSTEIRIASYLVAVRCAEKDDFNDISSRLCIEENTQVRGFILSHLLNLKDSPAYHKKKLRSLLSGIYIPANFSADMRKYSQNIDLSFYSSFFGFGAGVELDIIFAPKSFAPRALNLNLTAMLGNMQINLGELGIRVKELETMLEILFGPEGYFHTFSMSRNLEDVSEIMKEFANDIIQIVQDEIRGNGSPISTYFSEVFDKIYDSYEHKFPRADMFVRFDGQEVVYNFITKALLQKIQSVGLIKPLFNAVRNISNQIRHANISTTRVMRLSFDQSIPTIQGIPLKLELDGTVVFDLKMETNLTSAQRKLSFSPNLSTEIKGFIGFDSHTASCGVITKHTFSSNTEVSISFNLEQGFEFEVSIPKKISIFDMESETYMMKVIKGHQEIRVNPSSVKPSTIRQQNCFHGLEANTGFKVCYVSSFPDFLRSEGLPLGPPTTVKLTAEKSSSSIGTFRMKIGTQKILDRKEVKIEMESPGTPNSKKIEAHFTYVIGHETSTMEALMISKGSGTLNIEARSKFSESAKEMDIIVRTGQEQLFSSESKIWEAKVFVGWDGQKTQVHILTQTMNTLKPYIDNFLEVKGEIVDTSGDEISYPVLLHKFDLHNIIGTFKVLASMEKQGSGKYLTLIEIGSPNDEGFLVEAKHTVEGKRNQGFVLKTVISAKMRSEQYKAILDIYNTLEKIGIFLQIVNPQKNLKVIEFEAALGNSIESQKAKFQLDIPEYLRAVKFESNIEKYGRHRHQFQVAFKYGSQTILQADGTVIANFIETIKQFQTDVRLQSLEGQLHRISLSFIWSKSKKAIAFQMKDQEEPLFAIDWNMSSESKEQTVAAFRLLLHSLFDSKIDAIMSNQHVQISFNVLILPENSFRRIKGFADVDFITKRAKSELNWNADQDPNSKISAEATVITTSPTLQQVVVRGGWTYIRNTYHYKAEIWQPNSKHWPYGRRDLKIDLTTPYQETFGFIVMMNIHRHSSGIILDSKIKYKNPKNNEFLWVSHVSLEKNKTLHNFEINSTSDFTFPEGHHMKLILEASHQMYDSQRKADIQMNFKVHSMNKLLQTAVTLSHEPNSYVAVWKINVQSPATGVEYELKYSSDGRIQSLKVIFNIDEIWTLLDAILRCANMTSHEESVKEETSYLIYYEKTIFPSHKITIQSPFRRIEGEMKYSSLEYSAILYPERDKSDSKYELSFLQSEISNNSKKQDQIEGRLDLPSLKRMRMIKTQYSDTGKKMEGSVVLDIFQKPDHKITGMFSLIKMTDGSVSVEANLSGKVLKINPKVTLITSSTSRSIGFDVSLELPRFPEPYFVISGKCFKSLTGNIAMALSLKTDNISVVEVSTSVDPEDQPDCRSMKFSASTIIPILGTYNIDLEFCKSGFISVTFKNGSNIEYISKIGFLDAQNAEFSISRKVGLTQDQQYIAFMMVKLDSPITIGIKMMNNLDEASIVWKSLSKKWSGVSLPVAAWMINFFQEVFHQAELNPSATEIKRITSEIKQNFLEIYDNSVHSCLSFIYTFLQSLINSQLTHNLISSYDHVQSKLYELDMKSHIISSAIKFLVAQYGEFLQIENIGETSIKFSQLMERIRQPSLLIDLRNFALKLLDGIFKMDDASKEIFIKYEESLVRDLQSFHEDFVKYKIDEVSIRLKNYLNINTLDINRTELMSDPLVQMSSPLSATSTGNHLEVEIPSLKGFRYLAEKLHCITFENGLCMHKTSDQHSAEILLWSYYNLLSQNLSELLPPFHTSAIIIDGSEILTFDGHVLKTPHLPCKVVLAASEYFFLTLEHPQTSFKPHITIKTNIATITIDANQRLFVNGRETHYYQIPESDITVWKAPHAIKILAPSIVLKLYRKSNILSVEVPGWLFGKVVGLLGSNDGELANDYVTLQGGRASTLEELIRSWQVDQQCQTPKSSHVAIFQAPTFRSFHCQMLLGVRSRCHAVVWPEPFIKMCYTSNNPCNVARAYHTICASMGVLDYFGITC